MTTLLVSKIDDIRVLQVGESKISLKNKSEDGSKIGGIKEGGIVGRGSISNIDLGRGKQSYTLTVFAISKNESNNLFEILHEKRFCTITDKFKGKLKVYVEDAEVTDSDAYVGRTIFEINCTVQDEAVEVTVNNAVVLANATQEMESELGGMVKDFSLMCDDFSTGVNFSGGGLYFNDYAIELFRSGVMSIIDVKITAMNAYSAIVGGMNNAIDLFAKIKSMNSDPEGLVGVLIGITDEKAVVGKMKVNNSVTGSYREMKNYEKTELTPIILPTVRGVEYDDVDIQNLSQFEKEELKRKALASNIVNKTKVIRDLKSILAGGFNSQQDFEKSINQTIERLEYVGYEINKISEKVHLIKAYANDQKYREIIEIEVKENKPLVSIVYDLYGSLDNYRSIEAMNGFKNNDWVSGKVKVFS